MTTRSRTAARAAKRSRPARLVLLGAGSDDRAVTR